MSNEILTTSSAARLCNVSRFTIRNWVENGKLKSNRTAGGHRRISRGDLLEFMPEEARNREPLTEVGNERSGNADLSWKSVCDELDASMEQLIQKLKTCNSDELVDLQAKIKALEKCKRLTGTVISNLAKVKEAMISIGN